MRFEHSTASIVVLGAWNPRQFAVATLMANGLTRAERIGMRVNVQDPMRAPELEFDDMLLQVNLRRLQLIPSNPSKPVLERMDAFMITALERFSQTPVSALGINLKFVEENPSPELLGNFNLGDNGQLAEAGFEVVSTSLRRQLSKEQRTLNFGLTLEPATSVTFDFNFHFGVTEPREAVARIREHGVTTCLLEALNYLKICYKYDVAELEAPYVNEHNPRA